MNQLKSFEELECWKAGTELRRYISVILKKYPKEETYQLVSQIKRASRSVTNNIAEGYGRFHFKENAQFCRQSRGSLYELKDHFIISLDEEIISKDDYSKFIELFEKSLSILNGYINYLIKASKNPINV